MVWTVTDLANELAGGRIRRYVDMEAVGLKRQSEGHAAP